MTQLKTSQAAKELSKENKKNLYKEIVPSDLLEKKAKEDLQMVRGTFRIYEPGRESSGEKITCRKYHPSICPMFAKLMFDGCEYEIPLYVARFLNGIDNNAEHINGKTHTCSYATHGYRSNAGEKMKEEDPSMFGDSYLTVAKRTKRYGFESLEFAVSS